MTVATQVAKNLAFVSLLGLALLVLWEIPGWEQNTIAHHPVPASLKHKLPAGDTKAFLHHMQTRLPHYKEEFQRVGKKHGMPWTLLAAQAYQESHWNRNAMSPTGVRGIMMLTRATAADLGIENRLDPKHSIAGGARYLAQLYRQVPTSIVNPDRVFIALAAYNVGMGHIEDAQILAKRMNKNPDRWTDLKTVLPLLAQKQYYQTLPHRYARGWEPVQYVKRVRAYQEILEHVVRQEARLQSEL